MFAWLVLAACPKRAPDPAAEIAAACAAADVAWELRATGGLGPIAEAVLPAWTVHRGDPALGWRVVRLRVAEGVAAGGPAGRASFADARSEALACLDGDPLFAQQRREVGWAEALARLPPERAPCAAWGALAWVRWSVALDPEAASLDLPAVDALLDAVDGATDPLTADPATRARGLSLATRPAWAGQDRAGAAALLTDAVARDPRSFERRLDLYAATGDEALLAALRTETPRRPEDVGAWRAFGETASSAGLDPGTRTAQPITP